MTANYAQHFSPRRTPQTEQADARQVQNSAGGFSFEVDEFSRLERFLILGAEGGTYYAGERKLVRENARSLEAALAKDYRKAINLIVDVSTTGRAPKQDPAIFALAVAAANGDANVRRYALKVMGKVCRTGTMLFQFCAAVKEMRGWGRGLRDAVANWYTYRHPKALAYQLAKYRQRNGWSHRDLLRLCHAQSDNSEVNAILRWAVGAGTDERIVRRKVDGRAREYSSTRLPEYLQGFDALQRAQTEDVVLALIKHHGFTHEMVPSQWKNSPAVWRALLDGMPLGAMVRNLGKLSAVGVLKPLSAEVDYVAGRLANAEEHRKARIHPIAFLKAIQIYRQGHGDKGKLRWDPVQGIVSALNEGFYQSFDTVVPTGKRTLLAIDCSGSMDWPTSIVPGLSGVTSRVAAGAMAMVTARAEPGHYIMGFTTGLVPLAIHPSQRLDDVVRVMQRAGCGGTDCSVPMLHALQRGLEVDAFHVYTDNETWAGHMHPHQALKQYRDRTGIPAKLAVVAFSATDFTIADPSDPGMLDVVGFDTAAPAVIADFVRGGGPPTPTTEEDTEFED